MCVHIHQDVCVVHLQAILSCIADRTRIGAILRDLDLCYHLIHSSVDNVRLICFKRILDGRLTMSPSFVDAVEHSITL